MATVQISTTKYEFSHGRQPRGCGDWAFSIDGEGPVWVVGVPYTEAKAEAVRRAREAGATLVEVLP